MEEDLTKGLNLKIREAFGLKHVDIRTYSPLALAYIGDSVFDVIIRSILVDGGNTSVNKLHKRCVKYVSAKAQSLMALKLLDEFSDEEKNIFRRGKNTKMNTFAKNASMSEYRNATGLEAVIGYLYLLDNTERIFYLMKKGMSEDFGKENNER